MSSITKVLPGAASVCTLDELLHERARRTPDRIAYTFLDNEGEEEFQLTYDQLDHKARTIAAYLQSLNLQGERALLLYPPGPEYISAFFGCLYAGVVAVPAYPPRVNQSLGRLKAIIADARPAVALTVKQIFDRAEALFSQSPELLSLRILATDSICGDHSASWREPGEGDLSRLAFLQYTSGSTSRPRGVMVSHRNLLHNESLIRAAFGQSEHSTIVGWLPLYHDMGLIGNVLQPLFAGAHCVLMPPLAFLQSPYRWLSAISRYRATTSGGPNFAYELCTRKVTAEQRATLDLGTWRVAFNGAEPVRVETLEQFAEVFAECGFRREAFQPCYGLAEATLLVSAAPAQDVAFTRVFSAVALRDNVVKEVPAGDPDACTRVSCGSPPPDVEIVIVDPATQKQTEPGRVGEIWVAGESVTGGYWERVEETSETFGAFLADTERGPFLRTGDLGFLDGGELFITGRIKDLIIIRGLNHYPQDIELTVEASSSALRPGCGAAFSIDVAGEERLVVVQEADPRRLKDAGEVLAEMRRSVIEEHQVQPYAVQLLRAGSVPKTSSGKIQRYACREKFLANNWTVLAEWREQSEAEDSSPAGARTETLRSSAEIVAWLVAQIALKARVSAAAVEIRQSVAHCGLDSLAAVELAHGVETEFGISIPVTSFLADQTIEELANDLAAWVAVQNSAQAGSAEDPKSSAEEIQPLSYGQKTVWFLHQLDPASPAYNIAIPLSISEAPDVPVLRRALLSLVERHPSLRTTFAESDGEPVQRIHGRLDPLVTVVEVSGWNDAAIDAYLVRESQRPFNLEQGPLLRVNLLQRDDGPYVLLLVLHHIIVDFWSLAILMHELDQLYRAGGTSDVRPQRPSYADYVRAQKELLEGERGIQLRNYWEGQLEGELTALNLPGKSSPSAVQTYRGASELMKIDDQLTARLQQLSRAQGATLYMTLLAAFQVLLYRYSGQQRFFVGSPASGRSRAKWSGIVGYFVNPIPLRADFPENQSFSAHLAGVRRTVLSGLEHQDYPFAVLAEGLQLKRDLSRPQLFQVMFVFQKAQLERQEGLAGLALPGLQDVRSRLGDLWLTPIALTEQVAQFDLTLIIARVGDGLSASLQYNADLFARDQMSRLLDHYQTLLAEIVESPGRDVSQLDMLSAAERRQQIVTWNDTSTEQRLVCVQQLFEEQAEKNPGAIAVGGGHERLTYEELNRRANQLAHRLLGLGVGPEVAISVCLERSPGMVVAQLAVLKAGGFYVPLDPAYPFERLSSLLTDSGARVLITDRRHAAAFAEYDAHIIDLEGDAAALKLEPDTNPGVAVQPENLAYMIYTSGSTGSPKGVEIRHAGLINLVSWHQQAYGITSGDRAMLVASPAFDASVWELWPYLTSGASLHVPTEDVRASAPELWQWIASEEITICFVPTPLAEAMLAEKFSEASALRVMLTGGDKLRRAPREPLPFTLVNHYGPTENTVVATRAAVAPDLQHDGAPPIGRPIVNTQAYILDEHLQLVPTGVAGELYLGGAGLARGYHGQAALTALTFLPNPFAATPGERLYRTGDLVRYLPDGQIEFLGRNDHQVKISGFRIELGEIESTLQRHSSVREAVVVTRGDDAARKSLVAYVVPFDLTAVTTGELRDYLKERLPHYMLPANFLLLPELPLTPNGKVDRVALPDPAEVTAADGVVAPRTPIEELLASIWRQVLKVEAVSAHDNFFDCGGHSLLATQVTSRVRQAFGVELPLRTLFESPTIARLAEYVETALREGTGRQLPPVVAVLRDRELPLSSAQERLWFLDRLQPNSPLYNIPAAVRLSGHLDVAALAQSLNEIVRRHEVLRTTFAVHGARPVQIIAPSLDLNLPLKELSGMSGEEREHEVMRLASAEAREPFDLSTGPLLRTQLLREGKNEYVLLLTIHHIISDGWSIGILIRELKTLYQAYVEGRESPLPELTIQYADCEHWQRQLLEGGWLDHDLAYWRERLNPPPAVLELPADRPRQSLQTTNGAVENLLLSSDLKDALKSLSLREGATLFMTLLAAFKSLLYHYTRQEDVTLGTPVAGRNAIETEGLIGFFANTLVLRTDISGDPSFRELLARVRETVLGAYLHQNVPFEKLVEEFHGARDLSHTPLFQVMMALQNAHAETLELTGLTLIQLEVSTATAKFDLLLFCQESAEGLRFSLEYNTDLYERSTIQRLLGHWSNVLAAVAQDAGLRLSELPLMDHAERVQVLENWNDTRRSYDSPSNIYAFFEQQAAKTPGAVAVQGARESLTYRQLESRVAPLSDRLRKLGVGPEVLAGICMDRSPELVVALLAVLKAGGAYVPLDPAYPPQRMAYIVEQTRAPVLLTEERLRDRVPPSNAQIVIVEPEADNDNDISNPATVVSGNLAYVIYTSGSTGQPKGVAITHRSAVTLLNWAHETFTADQLRAVLASTSICFDLSVFELFVPLTSGGKVVLVDDALQLLSVDAEVSLVNTVPSAASELLRLKALPPSVMTVNLAGEALTDRLVNEIFAQTERVQQVWNLYGPSEDTTYSTAALMLRGARGNVTIGQPVANTQTYVLDARLQPVLIGVTGELYLGGEGLARGYLDRPDLTAERFIPNPFSTEPGKRLYRTGDLVRYLPDGRLEFLGRLDHQVKIRGFRIELGEIEAALADDPRVERVIVIARDDARGGKRLVAYIVAEPGNKLTPEDLRSHLRTRLPDYMIPSAFVQLDAMPLTPNGKIDRGALAAPDEGRRDVAAEFVAARNATEEGLSRIWCEVLGLREVGVHDNFFDLGGHSLLATQVMAKLPETFRIELPLRTLFESPTIGELASAIEAVRSLGAGPVGPSIRPVSREAFRVRAGRTARGAAGDR